MEKKNVLVSIIVPIYNVAIYLDRCIVSILNQDYRNIEVILVDDGATDNSPAICDGWAHKDNRVRVLHKKNGGLSDARNAGIRESLGDYIAFVDGDDFIEPDMISYLLSESSSKSITACRYTTNEVIEKEVQDSDNLSKQIFDGDGAIDFNLQDEIKKLSQGKRLLYGSFVWNKLFPRSFFEKVLFPLNRNFEDVSVIFQLYHQADQVVFLPKKKYHYIERPSSIINQKNIVRDDYITALKSQRYQLEEFQLFSSLQKKYFLVYIYVCQQMIQEIRLCHNEAMYQKDYTNYCNEIKKTIKQNKLVPPIKFFFKEFLLEHLPIAYRWIHNYK